MAGDVAEVKAKTDIVDVIGERLELKRAGRNFKAVCPFHNEKTPSFMVSPELQTFKCFGCGEAGDVFTFLEKYEGMEFSEALKRLADKAGVALTRQSFGDRGERDKLYEINALAQKFYSYILKEHPSGKAALDYLKEKRGLSDETINTFQLGYCPNVPFAARKFLVEKHKIDHRDIVTSGIAYARSGGSLADRFRGRVIFPLFDPRGNIIGFAGRILPSDEGKDLAKYINTPETPIYHKGSNLYGLNITRSDIKRSGEVIVVEGELDLISLYQAGIKNVVAIKGTAITEDQVRLISRYAKKIIVMLDADLAGDAAARRGIAMAGNMGISLGVTRLGKYKDPDEAAKADIQFLKKAIANPTDVWEFIIDSVTEKLNLESGEGKAQASRELVPVLHEIEDKIVQAHYAKYLADKLDVPENAVDTAIREYKNTKKVTTPVVAANEILEPKSQTRREKLEERLLVIVFQHNMDFFAEIPKDIVTTSKYKKIVDHAENFLEKSDYDPKLFQGFLPDELRETFSNILMLEIGDEADFKNSDREFATVSRELLELDLRQKQKELINTMKRLEKSAENEELAVAQKEFAQNTRKLKKLEISQ